MFNTVIKVLFLLQVVWWINLASLGLYVVMVMIASVVLQRGLSLAQKRIGVIFDSALFDFTDFSDCVKYRFCLRTFYCAERRRRTAASGMGAALRTLLCYGPGALLPPLLPCNALQ